MSEQKLMEVEEFSEQPSPGLVSLVYIIYALHGFSVLNGVLTPAFVLTAFLTGWPSIIAVILSYVKRDEARGTYLESHFSWVITTFWYAAFAIIGAGVLILTVILSPVGLGAIVLTGIWVIYRLIRGVMNLTEEKPLPLD